MFEKIKVKSLKYKTNNLPSIANKEYDLPALTAGIQNQGLNNYVPRENATILKNVISISANGANTGATFFQSKEFTVLQDAYAIDWIYSSDSLTENQYLFLVGAITKTIYGNYEWTNKAGWERIKNDYITLPVTSTGEIDFDFMESFIRELEEERIRELAAYLTVSGLADATLTANEEASLLQFKDLEWQEFNVIDIFIVKNTHNILSSEIVENSGGIPYLCASAENNGVSSYISFNADFLEDGNCIFIGGKTFVVSYQKDDFFSNDSHNLALYLKNENVTKSNQLYLASCITKSLAHKYSWGNSISNAKIKTDKIMLPAKNGKPDYEAMETFISAVQKLVIKDVVKYADDRIAAAKDTVYKIPDSYGETKVAESEPLYGK